MRYTVKWFKTGKFVRQETFQVVDDQDLDRAVEGFEEYVMDHPAWSYRLRETDPYAYR